MATRAYGYVGPEGVRRRAVGAPFASSPDLLNWLATTGPLPRREGLVAVTFVVDERGRLLVADRGSEHIA